MGTNYYQRTDICECCGRYKEKHIGKSSAGWQFSFQGYTGEEDNPKVGSFKEWKRELQVDGKIFNEYGEEMSFEAFIEMVEAKQNGKWNDRPNLNHFDHCQEKGYSMTNDWKDEEGFSFTDCDFS